MIRRKICLIFLLLSLALPLLGNAKENSDGRNKINRKEPIEITSDRMDAYNEKKMVVFSGNAIAKQSDVILKCDRLIVYYKKDATKKEKMGTTEVEGTGDLEKIEAKGNVNVTQKKRTATSDEAVYFQDSGQIVMTGNPIISEDRNVISGCKIIVFLNEDKGVVEACTSDNPKKERVKAVIYPQEKSEQKK